MFKTSSSGLRRLALFCLAIAGACFFTLSSLSAPALADDTDGGSGQGSGSGGDGCIKSGWRLVNDPDDIVWQDNGAGRECGNTAYGNRNNPANQDFSFTSAPDDTYRRCSSSSAGVRAACGGGNLAAAQGSTGVYTSDNTSLYATLAQMGAGGCYRRNDVYGIWYLQDAGLDGIRSWTNLGAAPDGQYRNVPALKDAIDDTSDPSRTVLVDSGARGDNAWWDVRIQAWLGENEYNNQVRFYTDTGQTRGQAIASVRSDSKARLMNSIKDVTGGNNPVIFCWYSDITKSGLTCGERIPPGMSWSDYLHPDGVTQSTTGVVDCIRRCPTAQGQYPNPLPHAGEWIPNANGSRNPRPASNSEDDIATYCYPPITTTWHQGGYGSEIPGIGYTVQGTQGSNTGATQPYAYVTTAGDGNGAYNSTAKTGNAPNQGQFTGSAATKKTAFGTFLDTYCAGSASCSSGQIGDPGSASYNAFVAAYNLAVTKQATETHAVLDLTDTQQAEVAKGRILNIVERTTYASAQARRLLDRFYTRVATRVIYYNLSGYERSNNTSYTAWTYDPAAHPSWNGEAVPADMRNVYRPDFSTAKPDIQKWDHGETVYGSTPKPTGFWQNAVTHCNNQEFSTLNPSGIASGINDAGVLDTGDASQYYSASAVYKVQDSNYAVNAPAVDFTQARWGATTTNASAKPAFFDRLCYYPGAAKNPTTMADKTTGTQGSFKFFRDGERYTLEGTKGSGDSPFFVPDFKGEDRTSTVTTVTGYTAKKSTRSEAEYWTVSYNETYQTSATYHPAVPTTYAGYYHEYYTCNIPRNQPYCIAPVTGSQCRHDNPLDYGVRWGPAAAQPANTGAGCQGRIYDTDTVNNGSPAYYSYTYGWRAQSATYSTDAAATAAYNSCVSKNSAGDPGRTSGCSKAKTDAVWSSPSQVTVPSCPMTDTSTERYTDCEPVTRTDTVTTNYNVVDYQNEDPAQVIVTRDPLSTPDASLATFYGLTNSGFSAKLFTETKNDVRTPKTDGVFQSQFATNPTFSSNTVAVASGAYKRLQAKGVWATDKNVPQVLTLAWYYTPNVRSTFANTNIGFGRAGGLMTYTKGEYSTPVRGRVEAAADSLSSQDDATLAEHQNEVWANTGTNIEDGLNVPVYYGQDRQATAPYGWLRDPSKLNARYFTVEFRRATSQ